MVRQDQSKSAPGMEQKAILSLPFPLHKMQVIFLEWYGERALLRVHQIIIQLSNQSSVRKGKHGSVTDVQHAQTICLVRARSQSLQRTDGGVPSHPTLSLSVLTQCRVWSKFK